MMFSFHKYVCIVQVFINNSHKLTLTLNLVVHTPTINVTCADNNYYLYFFIKVVMDNGLAQISLSTPGGMIDGIRYKGINNLLEPEFGPSYRG